MKTLRETTRENSGKAQISPSVLYVPRDKTTDLLFGKMILEHVAACGKDLRVKKGDEREEKEDRREKDIQDCNGVSTENTHLEGGWRDHRLVGSPSTQEVCRCAICTTESRVKNRGFTSSHAMFTS